MTQPSTPEHIIAGATMSAPLAPPEQAVRVPLVQEDNRPTAEQVLSDLPPTPKSFTAYEVERITVEPRIVDGITLTVVSIHSPGMEPAAIELGGDQARGLAEAIKAINAS